MDDEGGIEQVLDTIGDRHAREVLAALNQEPLSAKQIAERTDLSLPTVYRRLERLLAQDLVLERTEVANDGNHYNVYECNFEKTIISLEGDDYQVQIVHKGSTPDRFTDLWNELGSE